MVEHDFALLEGRGLLASKEPKRFKMKLNHNSNRHLDVQTKNNVSSKDESFITDRSGLLSIDDSVEIGNQTSFKELITLPSVLSNKDMKHL